MQDLILNIFVIHFLVAFGLTEFRRLTDRKFKRSVSFDYAANFLGALLAVSLLGLLVLVCSILWSIFINVLG